MTPDQRILWLELEAIAKYSRYATPADGREIASEEEFLAVSEEITTWFFKIEWAKGCLARWVERFEDRDIDTTAAMSLAIHLRHCVIPGPGLWQAWLQHGIPLARNLDELAICEMIDETARGE